MLISYKKITKILTISLLTISIAAGACLAVDNAGAVRNLGNNEFSVPLLEGGVSITNSPKKISMSLRDSDVRQVLRMLADKAGMNILMHDSVSGNVTLDLVNVSLNKAFEYVMVMNDLAYWVDDNTLIIAAKSSAKDLAFSQQQIRTFNVKYENAGRIAEFLNKNIFTLKNPGLSNDEIAITNPNTNQIMIVGTEKDFEIARKIIAQFDKKTETYMFKTNHLSAGKMAGIICHKVFKSEDISDDDEDTEGKGGAKIACSSKDIEGSEVDGTFSSFKSTGLVVTYYPDLGTIGITGATREQLQLVDEVISQNDIKQKQAILEIAILELSAEGTRTVDPSWTIAAGTFRLSASGGTMSIDFNANYRDNGSSSSSSSSGTSAASSSGIPVRPSGGMLLTNRITLAMTQGKGRVLSNPKILVKNNTESSLDITQEYISNITTQQSTSTIQPVASQTIDTDTYGIKMKIKPTITPDGYVYLDLNPSYSVPNGSFQVDSADEKKQMQLIAERDIELKGVRLKDNETLIIGGLIQETESKASNKVPILGDIPFIGAAFRSSSRTSNKNELIIIVTPKILNDDEVIMERM
ncbi:MAG: hypothetical protein K6A44_07340 [bacterium]|nr:hypothetical protein [bacterium]